MFGDIPVSATKKSRDGSGWLSNIKSLYNDPFKWQLVKSWVFFVGGIVLARELASIDLSSNAVPNP